MIAPKRMISTVTSYLTGRPIVCTWQATYLCNFKCKFCNYWQMKVDPKKELALEDFKLASEKLSHMGVSIISMAGGEPLIRKDIVDIVKVIVPNQYLYLTTNGFLVNEKIAKALFSAGLDGMNVSLDFTDPSEHDEQRGVKGAYEHAVNALKILAQSRVNDRQKVNMFSVLNRKNIDQIEDLILLAGDLGVGYTIQPYCELKAKNDEFKFQDNVSSRLLELLKKYKHFVSNPLSLKKIDTYSREGEIPGCQAGRLFFNIESYGNISRCVEHMNDTIGNIKDISVAALKYGLREEYKNNKCNLCWYNCRSEVESVRSIEGLFYRINKSLINS